MTTSSLLWLLQPPQGQPRWLFGSMHIRDERVHQWNDKLYPLIRQADAYIGEMDLSARSAPRVATTYALRDYFSETAFHKIRHQLLKSFDLDIIRYEHVHPLMAISAISERMVAADHLVSMDEHLWKFARENGLPATGLESFEEQMTLLHAIDPGPVYQQLRKIARNPSGMRKQTLRSLMGYLRGDIHQLYKMTRSAMHGLRKSIIYRRNQVMAERMLALPEASSYFIVVGAGHLSGKNGLLALVKRAGWKLIPLSLA